MNRGTSEVLVLKEGGHNCGEHKVSCVSMHALMIIDRSHEHCTLTAFVCTVVIHISDVGLPVSHILSHPKVRDSHFKVICAFHQHVSRRTLFPKTVHLQRHCLIIRWDSIHKLYFIEFISLVDNERFSPRLSDLNRYEVATQILVARESLPWGLVLDSMEILFWSRSEFDASLRLCEFRETRWVAW